MAFGYSPVSVVLLLTSRVSSRKGQPGLLVFVFTSRFNGCLVPALARGSVSQVGRVMGADPMSRSSCSSLSSPLLGAVVKKRASDDWSADGAKADQSVRPNHNPREDRRDDSRGLPNEELLPSRDSSRRELVERIAAVYVQVVPQEACHREQALPSENASSLGSGKGGSEVRGRAGLAAPWESRSLRSASQYAPKSADAQGLAAPQESRGGLQWKSPRHWHQGGTDAKSRVACPRKVVRGTRRRRGKLHQDDRCKFGERPSTLWRPVTSCTILRPVEKGSSSPASRRHRCEVSRRHSA